VLEKQLVSDGTLGMHKNIIKETWHSSYGHTRNQINHIIINRWGGSLMDVVARHMADIGSDYAPVLFKYKIMID
jgi:hypothetical protein